MLYAISRIAGGLLAPTSLLFFVCAAGAAISLWRRHSAVGRALLIGGVAGYAICAIAPVGDWLMRPLEDRFPPLRQMPARVDGIVILGGAIDLEESAPHAMPALNERAGRLTAFVALARLYPHARLVFTGGNPDPFAKGPTEADMARLLFSELGLAPARVVFERRSRNTRENALFSLQLVHPGSSQSWLLVTSAVDMPRAIGCFRAVGWRVIAFPVDYHARNWEFSVVPRSMTELRYLDWATHEWLGLVYYRLRGWTPSLFPGPHDAGDA